MRSVWLRRNFVRSLKFLEIKEGGPNFRRGPILQKVWIIWSTLLYFYFKIVKEPNSPPIRRFNCIFYDSGVVFSDLWKLCKSKRGDLISWGNQFCRKFELFGPPFCISILKLSRTQILRHFLDFNAFCMIHKNFCQTFEIPTNSRGRNVISGGNQFWRKSELFAPPLCISILKFLWTRSLCHSLDFNAFCMIQE